MSTCLGDYNMQLSDKVQTRIRVYQNSSSKYAFITPITTVACICTNLAGSCPQLVMNKKAYKFLSCFITMKFITVQKSHTTLLGQFT